MALIKWLASLQLCAVMLVCDAHAATKQEVIDIPTRAGVSTRVMVLTPEHPHAVALLFVGGNGGVRMERDGKAHNGRELPLMSPEHPEPSAANFLVRARQYFADQGLVTLIVDAPSDRQQPPFLAGFRLSDEHVADVRAVMAWARARTQLPVWLVGTSRGTISVAWVATKLQGSADAPAGIVLTSSILRDKKEMALPDMPLDTLTMPVLVVHHSEDACSACKPEELPRLMSRLTHASRAELIKVSGGDAEGDPCEPLAHHGYNGIELDVVRKIAAWMQTG